VSAYHDFLREKFRFDQALGFEPGPISPILKPHQRDIVQWAVRKGRAAIFAAFGLGKTLMQLEVCRLILAHHGSGRALIVAPLGVRQEFRHDAELLGLQVHFIRTTAEASADGIYLTNYESVRDGKIDPSAFLAVSLDEAAVLRGFGGTKTFREFMRILAGDDNTGKRTEGVRYRFVATATPSPNQYMELLAYAAFLGIMDVGQAKTRFFKRNSEKADQLTIHPHKEAEFWYWINSWAIFLQRPSDLGHSDEGYVLPPIEVHWHEVAVDHRGAGAEKDGQLRLLRNAAIGVQDAAREKRDSLDARVEKMVAIVDAAPGEHFILWHDLEDERRAIKAAIPESSEVYGSLDLDVREARIVDFSEGRTRILATKPELSGSGCNFQRHCHRAVFLGIGFKFSDFVQAIHRIQRFLQTEPVRIDLIYTESEREIRRILEEKWARHIELVDTMSAIIREHGLASGALEQQLARGIGCTREEVAGRNFRAIHNDCVDECATLASDSIDLILTSIPFATQYEYTPSYNDFGHTDDNPHFWRQMDFLTPNLYRVLKPGRVAAIHVKDRITPGGINGFGFQTVEPFSDECIAHFRRHGFAFLARKTIVTDVVRENNQTYRLGWTEQCKDGSRMGCGMPEYVLYFRKPPTDRSDGYADEPVVKNKGVYSRARWQLDAHGYARSSGDRFIAPEEFDGLEQSEIFRKWREHSRANVYDFENHVAVCEGVDHSGWLPTTFMLLPPASWHDDVWDDVTRMMTLNSSQARSGQQMHLCPLQFDICDRVITQFTNEGETVLDPFGGLMTVPVRAMKFGRKGIGVELNPGFFRDGVGYCRAAEAEASTPTLFDFADLDKEQAA
jgi:hypothetical protein